MVVTSWPDAFVLVGLLAFIAFVLWVVTHR